MMFPAFHSLPSCSALPQQNDVAEGVETVHPQEGMTNLTAADEDRAIAVSMEEILSESFNPATSAASSSVAASAAVPVEVEQLNKCTSNDLDFFFANIDTDFSFDPFLETFPLCDP